LLNPPPSDVAHKPRGNVHRGSGVAVGALSNDNNDSGVTIALVTHDPEVAEHARRVVGLRDGRLVRDEPVPRPRRARDVGGPVPHEGTTSSGV
jgi:putative ABC transport system ATP-binding protein